MALRGASATGSRSSALARDDHEVGLGQLGRVEARLNAADELGAARHRKPALVQRRACSSRRDEHRHLGDPREMPGEEAPDHAGAGDADALIIVAPTPA